MHYSKNIFSDHPEMIGVPFDPFGNDDPGYHKNARIIPSQFDFPVYPSAFSLLRNTAEKDSTADTSTNTTY